MAKNRPAIPRTISERVLKEYHHKCAICGRDRPHLHHIDEDSDNNDRLNLLPLCPNCHLQDVHDPTQRPDPDKLRLFRRYKDPLILDPRFHPIFRRLLPVRSAVFGEFSEGNAKYYTSDLLDFIGQFEMGTFYQNKIRIHIKHQARFYAHHLFLQNGCPTKDEEVLNNPGLTRKSQEHCIDKIEELLVELLRYQQWIAEPFRQA